MKAGGLDGQSIPAPGTSPAEHGHKFDFRLAHPAEVSQVLHVLLQNLGCDHWYVACHREHLFVYHLTSHGVDRYAACFQCTPPVDKGIYHGSKAREFSIIPLAAGHSLGPNEVEQIETVFACAPGGAT